ncbi:MAG: MBL fold metallo-hydrolase [Clostridiales bacterium]|jgi:glyoxylase-like metal-dependent hydrolase (beta-lactamase superfamily II)|nr:MBL fold metallo-hydrolase [Clostridiales bacterium]
MKVLTMPVGPVETNCYITFSENCKCGILIDPGAEPVKILAEIAQRGIRIFAIFATHGHFDHIGAVDRLRGALEVPAYASQLEAEIAGNVELNRSGVMGREPITCQFDKFLLHERMLDMGFARIKPLLTPGHTQGHTALYLPDHDILFSGDCLFKEGYGRYDLPTSDFEKLKKSLISLFELPEHTRVFPGHGPPTTIRHEKLHNPILKEL